ncbi:hypothetical protein J6590_038681 [Homalodisca vitripennis]|nr:hypothetical protein J6590_038681 [Homalodisca vitripennis]
MYRVPPTPSRPGYRVNKVLSGHTSARHRARVNSTGLHFNMIKQTEIEREEWSRRSSRRSVAGVGSDPGAGAGTERAMVSSSGNDLTGHEYFFGFFESQQLRRLIPPPMWDSNPFGTNDQVKCTQRLQEERSKAREVMHVLSFQVAEYKSKQRYSRSLGLGFAYHRHWRSFLPVILSVAQLRSLRSRVGDLAPPTHEAIADIWEWLSLHSTAVVQCGHCGCCGRLRYNGSSSRYYLQDHSHPQSLMPMSRQ